MIKVFNVVWGQIFVSVVSFVGLRIYTELLDRDAFGIGMLAIGILSLFDGMTVMAINQTLIALCSRIEDGEPRRQLAVGLAAMASTACGVLVIPVTLGLVIVSIWWPTFREFLWLPGCVALYLGAEFIKSSLQSLLNLRADYLRIAMWNAGEAAFGLLFTVVLLKFWDANWISFLTGQLISRVFSAAFFVLTFTGGAHLIGVTAAPARAALGEALEFGTPVMAMAPLGWVSAFLDRFIIASMLGTASTGTYVAATSLVGRPYALTTSVLTSYFRPQLFMAVGDEARRDRVTRLWLLSATGIGLLGAAGLMALGDIITRFMLAEPFRPGAVGLMVGVALAQTLSITTHGLDNTLLALGQSAALLKIQSVLSVLTLAAIPIGVAWDGAFGAVAARCFAEAVKLAGTWILTRHLTASAPINGGSKSD